MTYEIKNDTWYICKMCNKTIKELSNIYGGSNIYYTNVFKKHLINDHNISLEDYFSDILPQCPCGVCNKKCRIGGIRTSKFKISMACGLNDGVKTWSQNAKTERLGIKNPMYNKKPWNKGIKFNETIRKKMSKSAIDRINRGDFYFTNTKPHLLMCDILSSLNVSYIKEKEFYGKIFDIYLDKYNILIEVDGDYWHCNPIKYPNGPINDIQKKTIVKDNYKNKLCLDNNINLIRFWESDILQNREKVICTLKELLRLEN